MPPMRRSATLFQKYDRVRPLRKIEKFPRLKTWTEPRCMARPSTHSFPQADFKRSTGPT